MEFYQTLLITKGKCYSITHKLKKIKSECQLRSQYYL